MVRRSNHKLSIGTALGPRCSKCKSPITATWGKLCSRCGREFGKGARIDYWYHRAARGFGYLVLLLLGFAYVWWTLYKARE